MRALLVTHGTRGDVQPLLALSVALRERGHEAVPAASGSFAAAASEHGVEFAPRDEGPNRLLDDPLVREAIDGGCRGVRGKVAAVRTVRRIKPLLAAVRHGAAGRDRLVSQAFSGHVTPVGPGWPASVRTTGFRHLPVAADWSSPDRLAQFLDTGSAAVDAIGHVIR